MIEVSIEDNGLTTKLSGIQARADAPGQDIFRTIGELLVGSVRENFNQEGRPSQWIPSRSAIEQGRKTLTLTGRLANSPMISKLEATMVEVTTGAGLGKYPIFLSRGTGPQTITKQQRKFFWMKFYQTGLTSWKAMALSRILKGMPARRFSVIQDQDAVQIKKLLGNYIINGQESIQIT